MSLGTPQKYIKVTEKIPEKPVLLQHIPFPGKTSANPLASTEKLINSPDGSHVKKTPSGNVSAVASDVSNPPSFMQLLHHHENETSMEMEKLYLVNSVEVDLNQLPKHAKRSIGLTMDDDRRESLLETLESFTPFPALNAIYAESLETIAGRLFIVISLCISTNSLFHQHYHNLP